LPSFIELTHLKTILHICIILIIRTLPASSQGNPIYFDKIGKAVTESQAYYYRQSSGKPNGYESFYVSNEAKFFEGTITQASSTDESQNVYSGTCTWYYKNGKKKMVRTFNEKGIENGTSYYYFESGKVSKEIDYKAGTIVDNTYKEYNEDGQVSRVFEEDFTRNTNDWDLYKSDKSSSRITNGIFELTSLTKEGTSRYINVPSNYREFSLEALVDIAGLREGDKAGLIYGFKDWQNYNFFLITASSFYIGTIYEGVSAIKAEGMYSGVINKKAFNSLKILSNGEKNVYSINGEIQFSADRFRNFGSNVGVAISGKSTVKVDKIYYKDFDYVGSETMRTGVDIDVKATGSGLIFSKEGYIITNHHVVDDTKKIVVEVCTSGDCKSYSAVLVKQDIDNDLAVIKISDERFKSLDSIRYSFKETGGIEVGASVFTIGYPMALSGMGKEAKFTDGRISAKTGYNNAINAYQTSIPVQPGNSGGPLFNEKGQLLGVINARIKDADNVSYAVKLNYIKNLIELLNDQPPTPSDNSINTLSLEEKIKVLSNYVVLVKVK
jgi:S1-C subfamily serine protease